MTYLIDTNVVSEVRKGRACDANVAAWYAELDDDDLYLSVLAVGEVRNGIERLRRRDRHQAERLEQWLVELTRAFGPRILGIDRAVAEAWGRMAAIRPVPAIDGLMAATAMVHDLTLATRNLADVAGLGAKAVNPWAVTPP
ncbi:MAG: type II toxin-antitoxin system VapC family toxin [Alphaproteobacteria bacterium]|nr:type II toxin-antitoxin system VapC family toxin [Alphaproteobacteria bacterium]